MSKTFTQLIRRGAAALLMGAAALTPWTTASADLLLNENFDYPVGDLYNQGGWVKYAGNTADPIQVVAGSLTYAGYQDVAVGGKASMVNTASAEDLQHALGDKAVISTGTFYASFLMKVTALNDNGTENQEVAYPVTFVTATNSLKEVTDEKSAGESVKLYVKKNASAEDRYFIGLSKSANSKGAVYTTTDYAVGDVVLIVMAYDFDADTPEAKLWVNPTSTQSAATLVDNGGTNIATSSGRGIMGIELRQGATSSKFIPTMEIDVLRASQTWADLFAESSVTPPATTPTIVVDQPTLRLGEYLIPGSEAAASLTVGGTNLTGDITITASEGITVNPATVAAADVTADTGVAVNVTVQVPMEGEVNGTITLASPGAENMTVAVTGSVMEITASPTLAGLKAPLAEEYQALYTGSATVTFVNGGNVYLQDASGAVVADYATMDLAAPAVGDVMTGVIFMDYGEGTTYIAAWGRTTAQGQALAPRVMTVAELNAAPESAWNTLIQVADVRFDGVTDTELATGRIYKITNDGTTQGNLRLFAGTDVVGTAPSVKNMNITGILQYTSLLGNTTLSINPRSLADIEELEAPPATVPTIAVDPDYISGYGYGYQKVITPVTVTGSDLTGDITFTLPAGWTAEPATVTATEAMAEGGKVVRLTATMPNTDDFSGEIKLSSEGAEDFTLGYSFMVVPVTAIPNAAQIEGILSDPNRSEYDVYIYTGKAVITYVQPYQNYDETAYKMFAQDMTGGLLFDSAYCFDMTEGAPFKVGDEVSNVFISMEELLGAPVLYPVQTDYDNMDYVGDITATGKTKTPTPATITDIQGNLAGSIYRLFTLDGLRFKDMAGGTFEADQNYTVTDGTNDAVVRIFAGSDIVGTEIPAGMFSLTGISRSVSTVSLSPRDLADIVASAAGTPMVTYTKQSDFDFTADAAPIGTATQIATITVDAENLPSEAPITFTGADAALFSAVPAAVPAGTAKTEVKIMFTPTKPGVYTGNAFFDFDGIDAQFNQTYQFQNCKAYDPENLPKIIVDPHALELIAAPGETVTGQFYLSAENAFDAIEATIGGDSSKGDMTISSVYFLPDSKNVLVTVTYSPKAVGETHVFWTFNTTKCAEPETLSVDGYCEGVIEPGEKEGGDEYDVTFTDPLTYYFTDFSEITAEDTNKPFEYNGWVNLASIGNRAWWAYDAAGVYDPAFKAAKVTAYDSQAAEGMSAFAEMMLFSPALDFKNTEKKVVSFRVMGDFLNENSEDMLLAGVAIPGEYGAPFTFLPLEGFEFPILPDEDGKWVEYNADLTDTFTEYGISVDAIRFVFCFDCMQGRESTTTYYVTDFKWGDEAGSVRSIGFGAEGLSADAEGYYNVYNTQGVLVLRTREASKLKTLPSGLYITNGRKHIVK